MTGCAAVQHFIVFTILCKVCWSMRVLIILQRSDLCVSNLKLIKIAALRGRQRAACGHLSGRRGAFLKGMQAGVAGVQLLRGGGLQALCIVQLPAQHAHLLVRQLKLLSMRMRVCCAVMCSCRAQDERVDSTHTVAQVWADRGIAVGMHCSHHVHHAFTHVTCSGGTDPQCTLPTQGKQHRT